MTPVDFPERNDEVVVLNKPVGAFRDGTTVTTVWALSPEEMLEVMNTGVIYLTVQGHVMPNVVLNGHRALPTQKN